MPPSSACSSAAADRRLEHRAEPGRGVGHNGQRLPESSLSRDPNDQCIQCLEPFEEAWPERCPACKFAVRDKQAQRFGQEYVGNIRVGPSTSIEDELAIAEEMVEREERKKNDVSVRKPSIIIPRTW